MRRHWKRTFPSQRANDLIAVANASPLIYLAKLGLLRLLRLMFAKVITSEIVRDEVLVESAPEFVVLNEAFSSWLEVVHSADENLVSRLIATQVHRGEATVIAIAKDIAERERKPVVIIDDLAARDLARTFGLKVTGTIGVLMRARNRRLLSTDEAKLHLRHLVEETDFRVSPRLYSKVLSELMGE